MTPSGSVFVIGCGPMIGSHVARLFATHGFPRVALFSRSINNLSCDASFVTAAAPFTSVKTYAVDVTDHNTFKVVLERAVSEVGEPEVVIYNAARIKYGLLGQHSSIDMIEDFKVPNLGLCTTASLLLPYLQKLAKSELEAHPALLVTSGAIIHHPFAPVFSLSMAKAAQASLTTLLAEQNKDVVHVALVTVGGQVSPEDEVNKPENIATRFWSLYDQKKGNWDFEIRCGW